MRIGIDASLANSRTGTGNYALHLVTHLLEMDHENDYVLYFRRRCSQANPLFHLEACNLTKIVTDAPSSNLRIQANLAWRLYRDDIDVYHSLGFFLPFLWRGKSVVTVHDVNFLQSWRDWWRKGKRSAYIFLRLQARLAARRASRIITVSQWSATSISAAWNVAPWKIAVTPHGLPLLRQEVDGASAGGGALLGRDSQRYLLSVSTLWPHKNFERLIRAFQQFRSESEDADDVKLVIAGGEDAYYYRETLRPLVLSEGLEENVVFTGFVPDSALQDLYRGAAAFVLPSLAEGFGLPLLEAMAAGVPVITSNVAAMPEVVGDAALLVDPYSVSSIADAIRQLMTNQRLREDLIERGLRRCSAFSWERTAEQTLAVYRAVYEGRKELHE